LFLLHTKESHFLITVTFPLAILHSKSVDEIFYRD